MDKAKSNKTRYNLLKPISDNMTTYTKVENNFKFIPKPKLTTRTVIIIIVKDTLQ